MHTFEMIESWWLRICTECHSSTTAIQSSATSPTFELVNRYLLNTADVSMGTSTRLPYMSGSARARNEASAKFILEVFD